MISRLIKFFNQPYPDADDIPSILKSAVASGLVVFLVLFLLQPFGLSEAGSRLLPFCLQFAGITSAITLFFDLTVRFVLGIRRDRPEWTFWKWLAGISVLILMIALGNYAFIIKMLGGEFTLEQFSWALYTTVVIGIFPIGIFGSANMIRLIKSNRAIAEGITPQQQHSEEHRLVELPVNKSKKTFKIDAASILYVEAMQNYVNICYRTEEAIRNELLRNTISAMEAALADTPVRRCHRSFLVNSEAIESISGNAQGLKLKLEGLDEIEVPVSRKFIADFRN